MNTDVFNFGGSKMMDADVFDLAAIWWWMLMCVRFGGYMMMDANVFDLAAIWWWMIR